MEEEIDEGTHFRITIDHTAWTHAGYMVKFDMIQVHQLRLDIPKVLQDTGYQTIGYFQVTLIEKLIVLYHENVCEVLCVNPISGCAYIIHCGRDATILAEQVVRYTHSCLKFPKKVFTGSMILLATFSAYSITQYLEDSCRLLSN